MTCEGNEMHSISCQKDNSKCTVLIQFEGESYSPGHCAGYALIRDTWILAKQGDGPTGSLERNS